MLVGHLCVFPGEMSLLILCHFKVGCLCIIELQDYFNIQWPLNTGLDCVGPVISTFFPINTVTIFSLLDDFLNIFFSLSYFIVRIRYIIHVTYKLC